MELFICDMCHDQIVPALGAYSIATSNGGKSLKMYRFPMGSRLQEPHDHLYHICSNKCLDLAVGHWQNEEIITYQQKIIPNNVS